MYQALATACPNAIILEGYGVTECSPIVSVNRPGMQKHETIGQPLPTADVAVVDADTLDRRVNPGDRGMLLVSGPMVFSGYLRYDGPSPFVEFEHRRWYRTGDLVRQEPDGGYWCSWAG